MTNDKNDFFFSNTGGRFLLPSAPHATVLEVSIEEAQNDEQVAVETVDEEEKSYQVVFTFQAGRCIRLFIL